MSAAFSVRPTGEPRSHARPTADADTPVEAAIAFVERWLPEAEGEVSVTVTDAHTGHEQCFRIDLDEGESKPC